MNTGNNRQDGHIIWVHGILLRGLLEDQNLWKATAHITVTVDGLNVNWFDRIQGNLILLRYASVTNGENTLFFINIEN